MTLLNINICGINLRETIIHFHKNGRQTVFENKQVFTNEKFPTGIAENMTRDKLN